VVSTDTQGVLAADEMSKSHSHHQRIEVKKRIAGLALASLLGAGAFGASPAHASGVYGPDWRSCGMAWNGLGVVANKVTSCSFAKAAANTYLAQRTRNIRVYSKVTHRHYNMTARMAHWPGPDADPYLLITGGKGAKVKVVS
jgi:hypothetical protein